MGNFMLFAVDSLPPGATADAQSTAARAPKGRRGDTGAGGLYVTGILTAPRQSRNFAPKTWRTL
jgi:hypothetical protein